LGTAHIVLQHSHCEDGLWWNLLRFWPVTSFDINNVIY
jgi:hypothetical protein